MDGQRQWDAAVNSYLSAMKSAGVGNSTRVTRRSWLTRLNESCQECGPWDVSKAQIAEFLNQVTQHRSSRKKAADAVRSFYAWGQQRGWIEDNPATDW